MNVNPYAPLPTTPPLASPDTTSAPVRDGRDARTRVEATWPCRCVVCNAEVPTAGSTLNLWWHPRWVYVFVPIPLIFVPLFLTTGRTVRLRVGLCPACGWRRRLRIAGAVALLGASFLLCAGFDLGRPPALVLFVAAAGIYMVGGVRATRVVGDVAWVRAGRAFVASLPERPLAPGEVLELGGSAPSLDD